MQIINFLCRHRFCLILQCCRLLLFAAIQAIGITCCSDTNNEGIKVTFSGQIW